MILLIPGSLAAFREQLVDQRSARLYVSPSPALRLLDAPLLGGDSQFMVLQSQQNLVSSFDPKSLPEGRGDHDSPILTHTRSSLFIHGTFSEY